MGWDGMGWDGVRPLISGSEKLRYPQSSTNSNNNVDIFVSIALLVMIG